MRETIHRMKLYEPAEFIYTFLRFRLVFKPVDRPVALHITCSMRKMGLADTLIALARLCSTQVFVPGIRTRGSGLLRFRRRPWFYAS